MIDLTYEEKAKKAWGDVLPDWVEGLAKALDGLGSKKTGYKIGYSRPALSAVIANKYHHETAAIERVVRSELMRLDCPLLGETISESDCSNISSKPFNFSQCKLCENYREKNDEKS